MNDQSTNGKAGTHIYVLLDRSGSMQSIADDVIGGFNHFIRKQREAGPDARVTLVQFDSSDPHELVHGGKPVSEVPPLTAQTFTPRGSTPLLDATMQLILRARTAGAIRRENNLPPEHIVFVSITDGMENASHSHGLEEVRRTIAQCEEEGWVFVFLSAALDAYGDASRMGLHHANIQAFSPSRKGVALAFDSLSEKMVAFRRSQMEGPESPWSEGFFDKDKPAEEHRKAKEQE